MINLIRMGLEERPTRQPEGAAKPEGPPPPKLGGYETAPQRAAVGYEHFAHLFEPIKGIDELILDNEAHQLFRDTLTKFLTDRAKAALVTLAENHKKNEEMAARARTALYSLMVLSETLGSLPQGITEVSEKTNRKQVSFVITPPKEGMYFPGTYGPEEIKYIRLDVVLKGTEYTPRQVKVGFYDRYKGEDRELASLRFDVHHLGEENRLQMDLEGSAVELVALKHVDFPPECSDQKTFAQLQRLLIANLCLAKAKYKIGEFHLHQLLKELGLKEEHAKERREIVDKIMAQYPGTPQHAEAQKIKEKQEQARQGEEERQGRIELLANCENTLGQIVITNPGLAGWVDENKKEKLWLKRIPSGRIVLGFLLGRKPRLLNPEEAAPQLPDEEIDLLPVIPGLLDQRIEKGPELGKPGVEEALDYVRKLIDEMLDRQPSSE